MIDLKKLVNWLSGTSCEKKEEAVKPAERRRFQRLQLEDCEVTFFAGGPFPVQNLSYGGFRVDLAGWPGLDALAQETLYDCQLKLPGVCLACQVVVKNRFGSLVGCAFSGLTPAQSSIITDFIRPRIIGDSLREINASRLKNDDPNLKMRWFQGDNGAQVFLWQTLEGECVKQEFYFYDYVMAWDKAGNGLRTGKAAPESRSGFGRISPDSIVFFKIPPYRALKLGRTVLECSCLPEEARERILREIAAEEKRLFHRYIVRDSGVVFVPDRHRDARMQVINISTNGIAVYQTSDVLLESDDAMTGLLMLNATSIPVIFYPAYQHAQILGGRLKTQDVAGQSQLEEFLAPRLLAQYLEEVPAPPERPPYAPATARCYLYTGLHNTHLLSLITCGKELYSGRIAFMDRALKFHNNSLTELRCPEGLIFPGDWELEPAIVQPQAKVDTMTMQICREMIENADQIEQEVKQAWIAVLSE